MIQVKPQLFAALRRGGPEAVLTALGTALELEHSTIPPYLYALYSLDPSKNAAIADIIQSVVVEEMLHMTLVCNVVNALGGSPAIDRPDFVPSYPSALPGSVESGLIVGLAPASIDLVHDTFMVIEQPEDPIPFPVQGLVAAKDPLTIGEFYAEIETQLKALPPGSFSERNQIGPDLMSGSVVVSSLDTALQAITVIVDQGEGTSTSPLEGPDSTQVAHYYRFAEIYYGKKLIPSGQQPPAPAYVYGGAPVVLDPTGVYPAPTNPKLATYPAGSGAYNLCANFNYDYTSLLKTLHATFNGEPDRLGAAIGLMMSLKQQAVAMMSDQGGFGSVGPSFEYQPADP